MQPFLELAFLFVQDDSPANIIMLDVRKRKGLKPQPNSITGMCTVTIDCYYACNPLILHASATVFWVCQW